MRLPYVCNLHFEQSDYLEKRNTIRLKEDAVPSLNLPVDKELPETVQARLAELYAKYDLMDKVWKKNEVMVARLKPAKETKSELKQSADKEVTGDVDSEEEATAEEAEALLIKVEPLDLPELDTEFNCSEVVIDDVAENKDDFVVGDMDSVSKQKFLAAQKRIQMLELQLHQTNEAVKAAKQKKNTLIDDMLSPYFTADQITAYKRGNFQRIGNSSVETVKRCIEILDFLGPQGYKYVREEMKIPLLSKTGIGRGRRAHGLATATKGMFQGGDEVLHGQKEWYIRTESGMFRKVKFMQKSEDEKKRNRANNSAIAAKKRKKAAQRKKPVPQARRQHQQHQQPEYYYPPYQHQDPGDAAQFQTVEDLDGGLFHIVSSADHELDQGEASGSQNSHYQYQYVVKREL